MEIKKHKRLKCLVCQRAEAGRLDPYVLAISHLSEAAGSPMGCCALPPETAPSRGTMHVSIPPKSDPR